MNFTQIAGHLGADPEERRTATGKKVTTLRVATNVWNDGKDETLWWNVSVWGDEFDNIIRHMKKGSAVFILGTMRKPRIWTDREGKPQVALDLNAKIVSFSPYGKGEKPADGEGGGQHYSRPASVAPASSSPSFMPQHMGGSDTDFGMASFASPGHYEGAPHSQEEEDMPF